MFARFIDNEIGGRFEVRSTEATSLLIPIYEFPPPDDPRLERTIEAVRSPLMTDERLVYPTSDSEAIDQEHVAFLICTFWVIDALVLMGEVGASRRCSTTRYPRDCAPNG